MKIVCAIFDAKAECWLDPFTCRARGEAARQFMASVSDERNHMLFHYPEDYTLFAIGEFNDSNGVLSPFDAPQAIMNGQVAKPMDENPSVQPELQEVK